MDSDRFGHLRQGWNIYAFDDMAAGLSVEASFIDMGLKKGFSLVVTDLARKEAAVLYASPAKPMEAMPSSPGDTFLPRSWPSSAKEVLPSDSS